jgi:hypothetical protein
MTEFYTVDIGKKSYLVCRETGKGRPTITVYNSEESSKLRRKIEKAIVEARQ